MIRIAVDVMGGDEAPARVIDGAPAAARHLDVGLLIGDPAMIEDHLSRHRDRAPLDIQIIHGLPLPHARCSSTRRA